MFAFLTVYHKMCVGGKCSLSYYVLQYVCRREMFTFMTICTTIICVWEGNVRFYDYMYNNNIMGLGGKCSLS